MKIIIRTDASTQIGSGHVMRCLTVAKNLRQHGCEVKFWMNDLPGNLIEFVRLQGFVNIQKAENADIYIIDHYLIGEKWEKRIRTFTSKIVVIDDLANRRHDCDLLLDQNAVTNMESRYNHLLPEHCVKILGPRYLIIRDEFIKERQNLRIRTNGINKLLVFMGGTDPTNETMKVMMALEGFSFSSVDVVVGSGNAMKTQISDICNKRGYHYHCQIDYIANLMQQVDFSIGAGGSTTWERCYLGLPSSSTIVAQNQILATEYAEKLEVALNLGWHEQVDIKRYKDLLINLQFINSKRLSENGLNLTKTDKPNIWLDYIMNC